MTAVVKHHCLALLAAAALVGTATAGTKIPVVDGHTHQGLKMTEGVN